MTDAKTPADLAAKARAMATTFTHPYPLVRESPDEAAFQMRCAGALDDRVRIARKVEVDSAGRLCGWDGAMDDCVGQDGVVFDIDDGDTPAFPVGVKFADETIWYFSPEALAATSGQGFLDA